MHGDDGKALITHLVQDSMQLRLIAPGAGQNGLVILDVHVQALEPLRPAAVQDAVDPDLVAGWPLGATHG